MGSLDKDQSRFIFLLRITDPSFCFCCAAISLSHIQETPATKERIAAFLKLDPVVRTFQANTKDSQEISSDSYTMSSKYPYLYVNKYLNECKM
ncbi:hypothetical protein Hanom_Chr13g01217421 [Helianthus anomalus]